MRTRTHRPLAPTKKKRLPDNPYFLEARETLPGGRVRVLQGSNTKAGFFWIAENAKKGGGFFLALSKWQFRYCDTDHSLGEEEFNGMKEMKLNKTIRTTQQQ